MDLADEEPDAAHFADTKKRPANSKWPVWSRFIRQAWYFLRDDRFYGAMGGMGRIYYSSISRYARDHNIPLYPFITYLHAIDDVWIEVQAEKSQRQTQS